MAQGGGLLNFFEQGDNPLGLALLAAGGPSTVPMDFGQRIAAAAGGALGARSASEDRQFKHKLMESQIAENASQAALRTAQIERQRRKDDYYLGSGAVAPAAGAAAGAAAVAPQTASGSVAGGAALKAAVGAPPDAPPPPRGKFAEWSQQYGIPIAALESDYFSNDGKGIADMLLKRGTPDIKVEAGYAYDANKTQPGFLPGLTTSANGTSTLRIPDPSAPGGVRIAAPEGALGAAGAYAEQEARIRAGMTPGRPVIQPGGRMGGQSQLQEIGGAAPGVPAAPGKPLIGPGYAGGSAAAAADGQRETLQAELAKSMGYLAQAKASGDASSVARSEGDVRAIQKELARLPGGPRLAPMLQVPTPAGPAAPAAAAPPLIGQLPAPTVQGGGIEFSPAEKAAQEATQAEAVAAAQGRGKAATAQDESYQAARGKSLQGQMESIQAAGAAAGSKIATYQQIGTLLGNFEGGKYSQAGMDIASASASLGLPVAKDLPNKEAAQALGRELALSLRNPAGGAGMPGAMSDADRNYLTSLTPSISQTAKGRELVIKNAVAVEQRNQQVAQFARNYEQKYGKVDNNFYTQLRSWSNANPLFGGAK